MFDWSYLGDVLGHDPMLLVVILVPGKDDLAIRHPAQLTKTGEWIIPVVDRHHGHRGVETSIRKGKGLGGCLHAGGSQMLSQHDCGWFHGHRRGVGGFV